MFELKCTLYRDLNTPTIKSTSVSLDTLVQKQLSDYLTGQPTTYQAKLKYIPWFPFLHVICHFSQFCVVLN